MSGYRQRPTRTKFCGLPPEKCCSGAAVVSKEDEILTRQCIREVEAVDSYPVRYPERPAPIRAALVGTQA